MGRSVSEQIQKTGEVLGEILLPWKLPGLVRLVGWISSG